MVKKIIYTLALVFTVVVSAQTLQHPIIYTTANDRPRLLNLIENYSWAKTINAQLHAEVDVEVLRHFKNPNAITSTIPKFATHSKQNTEFQASPFTAKHNKILALASRAAMLYYLTQDVKYAQFAADIIQPYLTYLASRTPQKTSIAGNAFYDPRTTYGPLALTYDFSYDYLKMPGATVYDSKKGRRVPFNNGLAQKAIANMVGDMLQEYGRKDQHGKVVSNHPILTAPGALFGILCIEDDVERERLFNVFWEKGTAHQNSFKNTILPIFGTQGIWPESLSYSFMPPVTMILNIIDRIKPELNIAATNRHIFEGNFLFDNLRLPDRRFVRYGDSKRNKDYTQDLYRYTLDIATRTNAPKLKQKAEIALLQAYTAQGGYAPVLDDEVFNNYQELQLFWGQPIPKRINGGIDFQKPTVIIEHAGIALQRNLSQANNETYGLCGIIGGAHYVHSHVTGIGMELYGANYVMAPNAGLPKSVKQRREPEHEHYFRLHAGNNTVIVNGTSHGRQEGSWKQKAHVWQNTAKNVASEPKHLEEPVSKAFNFATQLLKDEVNNATQQRTLGLIRTSEKTGYYFDMFRSKSNGTNRFHDYIYHNIGGKVSLLDGNAKKLNVTKTKLYDTDIGDPVKSPGWRFFEKEMATAPTTKSVKIRFDINYDKRYMHMFVPSGIERTYTKALAPPTREAKNGYAYKTTKVLAIRQEGEAWERPFIAVLEPSLDKEGSVTSITALKAGTKLIGTKVVSKVNGKHIIDYILCNDKLGLLEVPEHNITFKGHYAIVRVEATPEAKETVTLYIGEGSSLTYKEKRLELKRKRKGVNVFTE